MYDELIKRLRHSANFAERGLTPPPSELREAADAIEELVMERNENYADSWKMAFEVERDEHRWVPVSERLPEDGVYVLGRYANNDMAVVCVFEHDEDFVFWRAMVDEGWETDCDIEPTHWTPLPQPPKG